MAGSAGSIGRVWQGLDGWAEASDLRASLNYSWLILSVPLLVAILLPLTAPPSLIRSITPHCVWKAQFGRECPGCGLTTAFLHIGRGEWRAAYDSNAAGIPLYVAFLLNSVFWLRRVWRASWLQLARLRHVHG
jgi:Protein of unknown function (DUF2752)